MDQESTCRGGTGALDLMPVAGGTGIWFQKYLKDQR